MQKIIFLGTADAVADANHYNAHFALAGERGFTLIDCAANPVVRISQAGLEHDLLNDIILTHFHPDHISGLPLLLMDLWLLGRQKPLRIHGLEYTLSRLQKMMALYEWEKWPSFYPVDFHYLPTQKMSLVIDDRDFRIFASPVKHLIPNIGLRIESKTAGKTVAYSSDTEPCPEVAQLAKEADILIHEATGDMQGHSSAKQAGEIALQAGAKMLYLIHYPRGENDLQRLVMEAIKVFQGPVKLAEDLAKIDL